MVAILILIAGAALYWYAVRPLPKVSGEMVAPISAVATIERDARGIPHIQAASWQDAMFLQGYATAQDRLWQMDSVRRFGAGELSEVFGRRMLVLDERSRKMRLCEIAERAVKQLYPQERAVLAAYARGVNYFITRHRGDYPLEFSLPGHSYDPRPWTLEDSMLVGLMMFRYLTDTSTFELEKGRLLARAKDIAKFRMLFPSIQGEYMSPGSNAWAVSGVHTTDGKPLAANDPHLGYRIPGTWHLVQLRAPGLDVSGAALPGLPCVITGHNAQIAWGVTNLEADVLDLYREQIDDRTGQYLYQGKLEQAQLDRSFIRIRGEGTVELDTWVTRHGPVIATEKGTSYSMRWSAADGLHFPFFALNRASNWRDFRNALQNYWGPAQNFVYADTAGNIGYQAAGHVPVRPGFDGDVPLDGASGKFEWRGYIPFEQLPSICNPISGIIASANQDPFPAGFAYRVDGNFADTYRVCQIRALLKAKQPLRVADMLAIQKDVYSAYDYFLARQVIAAVSKTGSHEEMLRAAVNVLRNWNGQMDKDEAAPMITELMSNHVRKELVNLIVAPQAQANEAVRRGRAPGERVGNEMAELHVSDLLPRPQIVETLLRWRPRGWVANDDWDKWLVENLSDALAEARAKQGGKIADWRWGRMLEWNFVHPVGSAIPFVGRFFNLGPVEMSGSGTTVKQTTLTLGPSERMVVDLGDWDKSVQNLAVGESGLVASRHYKDQWPAFYAGKSFPMEFNSVHATGVLHVFPGK